MTVTLEEPQSPDTAGDGAAQARKEAQKVRQNRHRLSEKKEKKRTGMAKMETPLSQSLLFLLSSSSVVGNLQPPSLALSLSVSVKVSRPGSLSLFCHCGIWPCLHWRRAG